MADRLKGRVRLRLPLSVARSMVRSTQRARHPVPSRGVASIGAPYLKRFIGVDTRASSNAECNAPVRSPSTTVLRLMSLFVSIRGLPRRRLGEGGSIRGIHSRPFAVKIPHSQVYARTESHP